MQQDREDRPLSELFTTLTSEMSALVRQEVAIARTEITQKAYGMGKDIAFIAAGGAAAYAGSLALIAALIIVLRKAGIPWGLSALVVGSLVAGAGSALIFKGVDNLKHADLVPSHTIDSLKENAEWAKDQVS